MRLMTNRTAAFSHQLSAISRSARQLAAAWGATTLVAAGALVLVGCRGDASKAETQSEHPASVSILGPNDIAPADHHDLMEGLPVSGTLEPVIDIRIASPIPEVVDEVLVREGEAV